MGVQGRKFLMPNLGQITNLQGEGHRVRNFRVSFQSKLDDVSAFSRALSDITYTVHRSQSFSNYHVIYTYNIDSTPIHHKLNLTISIVNKQIITYSFSQLPTISLHPVTKPQLQLLEPSVWKYQDLFRLGISKTTHGLFHGCLIH